MDEKKFNAIVARQMADDYHVSNPASQFNTVLEQIKLTSELGNYFLLKRAKELSEVTRKHLIAREFVVKDLNGFYEINW